MKQLVTCNLKLETRKREHSLYEGGFSLLELLIYTAIVSVVMLIITSTFISLNRGRGRVESRSAVNSSLIFATEKLAQDVKAASSVLVPATTASSSSTLVLLVSGASVTYDVSAGKLRRKVGSGPAENLNPDIIAFGVPLFTKLENTNTILNRTNTSVTVELMASFNATSPDYQFAGRRRITVVLWR